MSYMFNYFPYACARVRYKEIESDIPFGEYLFVGNQWQKMTIVWVWLSIVGYPGVNRGGWGSWMTLLNPLLNTPFVPMWTLWIFLTLGFGFHEGQNCDFGIWDSGFFDTIFTLCTQLPDYQSKLWFNKNHHPFWEAFGTCPFAPLPQI
mgnify:CR=1 FL=1